MKLKPWIAVIAALGCTAAQAADSIQLNKYVVTGTYALDPLNGTGAGISGLEASAVTYARDRGTLFFVGDEGRGGGGQPGELHLALGDRPLREVDVGVIEAGQHAPSAEIDDLGAGQGGLVHADAAGDLVGSDGERPGARQERVHRADDAVVENHLDDSTGTLD